MSISSRVAVLLLISAGFIAAQPIPSIVTSNGPPTSGCGANQIDIDMTSPGSVYTCYQGSWVPATGGAGGSVSSVSGADAHITVANPSTTPVISFHPQTNDYSFSMISGLLDASQLPPTSAVWIVGAAVPPVVSCTAGLNFYLDTTTPSVWTCVSTNVWQKLLLTPDSGPLAFTAQNGADACGTVASGFDCLGLNSSDQLTLKGANGIVQVIGPNPPVSPSPGAPANQPLAGCGVEYTSGLSFTVGACQYQINGVVYNSPITTVTLAAADPTNPRIDSIIVDTTATAGKITGTPAATPSAPTVDPATQLALTFATVAATATTPTGLTVTTIYKENTEWTCTASANLNCASTSNPYTGTKDIEATAALLTNNVKLVKPAAGTEDLANYNNLVFYLRSKAQWPTGNGSNAARSISVLWLNGSTQKGAAVTVRDGTFGFSSSSTSAYQQISIPTSLFGANGQPVTTLEFLIAGNGGSTSIGFYIDQVTLQSVIPSGSPFANVFPGAAGQVAVYTGATTVGGITGSNYNTATVLPTIFLGSGLNNCTYGGTYSGSGLDLFVVFIDGTGTPNTFTWNSNNNAGASGVAITGSAQTLAQGVTITCLTTTGHSGNEEWDGPVKSFNTLTTPTPILSLGTNKIVLDQGDGLDPFLQIPTVDQLFLGDNSGRALTTGNINNSAFGINSGQALTNNNQELVLVGSYAGSRLTHDNTNITAVGHRACDDLGPTNVSMVCIGTQAGQGNSPVGGNTEIIAIGYESLFNLAGGNNFITSVGPESMSAGILSAAADDVAIGTATLKHCSTCVGNTAVGDNAGENVTTGTGNVFIGFKAGQNETGSNKLYIDNTNTASPLIQGDFSARTLVFNGTINNPNLSASLPVQTNASKVLVSSAIDLSGSQATGTIADARLPAKSKFRSCTVIIGDPGAASPVLANDNDSPAACSNDVGSDWTITAASCWADAGSPTVTPILTGGSGTSVLTGALTCGTASWAAGTLNGTPVVHSFSANGATCSSTPCTIDANITTAGGTAKYVIIKIVGTI